MSDQEQTATGDFIVLFPSKYIRADDLQGKDYTLTIKRIDAAHKIVGEGGRTETKAVLHFESTEKMMVLNKTNAKAIASHHGREMADWCGKAVTLYPTTCDAFGKIADCVRIRAKGKG